MKKGGKMANGARIVTDPKVARCLPDHTFVREIQNITLCQGNTKYNTFGNIKHNWLIVVG